VYGAIKMAPISFRIAKSLGLGGSSAIIYILYLESSSLPTDIAHLNAIIYGNFIGKGYD
jgi:hypothetical protein